MVEWERLGRLGVGERASECFFFPLFLPSFFPAPVPLSLAPAVPTNTHTMVKELHPTVLWAQRKDTLTLTIDIQVRRERNGVTADVLAPPLPPRSPPPLFSPPRAHTATQRAWGGRVAAGAPRDRGRGATETTHGPFRFRC